MPQKQELNPPLQRPNRPQPQQPQRSCGFSAAQAAPATQQPVEIGGPPGPEPTRFGDWERKGRCIDF